MADYIDIDQRVILTAVGGRTVERTVRYILDKNSAVYKLADVRPVVHGHWEEKIMESTLGTFLIFECSGCGTMMAQTNNFCPNCGVKMDLMEEL